VLLPFSSYNSETSTAGAPPRAKETFILNVQKAGKVENEAKNRKSGISTLIFKRISPCSTKHKEFRALGEVFTNE
jgi:hypothetical protein